MRSAVAVTPVQLPEVLLHVAVVRPVFLWGAPGIGKSSVNRMVHVHLTASPTDWLAWAGGTGIHSWVLDYPIQRPDHLAVVARTCSAALPEPRGTPPTWTRSTAVPC